MHSNTDLAAIPSAGRGEVRLEFLAIEGIEAGRARFQRLVTDLVKVARGEAREVAGNPGDWGIDTFVGQLAGGRIEIWQSKFFIRGIAGSQQRQIRESFQSARRKAAEHGFEIDRWTLVIPATMDAAITRWWDGWQARTSRDSGIEIELWQETDLRHLLLTDDMKGIRRHYFGALPGETAGEILDLIVPSSGAGESLFAYADQVVELIGRDGELAELHEFVSLDAPFAWWVWHGSAGSGKSRLALEICQQLESFWHVGFLSEFPSVEPGAIVVERPTLVVVDYAAQRVDALSDFLLHFARNSRDVEVPVRVLILERSTEGVWWTVLQRLHRTSESTDLLSAMYAVPRELGGVDESAVLEIIRATAEYLGKVPSPSLLGDIADHVDAIDERRRPLFVTIAAVDRLQDRTDVGTRAQVLDHVLTRFGAQLARSITAPGLLRQVRNLLIAASAVGGLSATDYDHLLTGEFTSGLIPDPGADLEPAQLDEYLAGVEPDLVGELYVLRQIERVGVEGHNARKLLAVVSERHWNQYNAFVARAADDHPEHPALNRLLDVVTATTAYEAERWGWLACEVLTHLARPDHPLATSFIGTLANHARDFGTEELCRLVTLARFRYANLWLVDDQIERSNELFTEALVDANPEWDVYAKILNNRGITWHRMAETSRALDDYSKVIRSPFATDESRACSLNNRADIYSSAGDDASFRRAIVDRSAVLALKETTFNRRYIALIRRSAAWEWVGDVEQASRDVATILSTPDIAVEQKMAARLRRARMDLGVGNTVRARADLESVVSSTRNFDGVADEASELLASMLPLGRPKGQVREGRMMRGQPPRALWGRSVL